jgi:hypothetical protein
MRGLHPDLLAFLRGGDLESLSIDGFLANRYALSVGISDIWISLLLVPLYVGSVHTVDIS